MTRDDVIRLAQEIGLELYSGPEGTEFFFYLDELVRFAELVAAAEREACEKMLNDNWYKTQNDCAAAIRARGEP